MAVAGMDQADLLKRIREIQGDASLSDAEKAKKRQALLSGSWKQAESAEQDDSGVETLHSGGDEDIQCPSALWS